MLNVKLIMRLSVVFTTTMFASTSYAGHAWGSYHWERSNNPFYLELGDNLSSDWDDHLDQASLDWSNVIGDSKTVVITSVVPGSTSARRCKPQTGDVQVCNLNYGNNGWLGIAGISISGGHITAGYVKLNDTYFNTAKYNTPAWKQMVTCQEIGHTFGLGHQDESFDNDNLGTCMDYTSDPDGSLKDQSDNQKPNEHDFAQLADIYSDTDAGGGGGSGGDTGGCNPRSPKCNATAPSGWGRLVSEHGPQEVFELDLGHGNKRITYVTWTLEHAESHKH